MNKNYRLKVPNKKILEILLSHLKSLGYTEFSKKSIQERSYLFIFNTKHYSVYDNDQGHITLISIEEFFNIYKSEVVFNVDELDLINSLVRNISGSSEARTIGNSIIKKLKDTKHSYAIPTIDGNLIKRNL